ncbi:hypothetical protein [Streptomyces sp. Root369]|uniref:hypothetical protein n=1 Tax=Streptomyces sp. Root369 TaxID=1736523 RepID=UPI00130154A5|nr:hypothetical protein [Streptomyces sp. Root369]
MPIRTLLIAVLVAAVAATILDARAPALRAAQPRISATRICDDSVNAMETEYGKQFHTVTSEPVVTVQAAAYTVDAQQTKIVAVKEKEAAADCVSKLHKATQAGWSYLSARAVEIAVDAVITILASALICSLTGPVGCKWGVRIASFTGGFVGALAFQYLTDGYLNWKSVGAAFFDATASMLTFSGLDKLDEKYVGQGVKATFKSIPQVLKTVGNRIGSAGSAMVSSISAATNFMITHPSVWGVFPSAYTGGGSIEPVIAEKRGQPIADGLQFRAASHISGSPVHDNLWSGAHTNPYYNWDVAETPHYNKDGAVGYLIGQGNSCLGYNASPHVAGDAQTLRASARGKKRSRRARLPGKASSRASTAPAQSAGRVTSCRPGTTARYWSCSWTNCSESATPGFSNSPRSMYGWTSRPTPDSWCSAVSNSKRPRRKEVAQQPGTLWRSARRVRSPSVGGWRRSVRRCPLPMTTASKSVVVVTVRRPLGRSARTGRPWPRRAPGRRRAGAPSP